MTPPLRRTPLHDCHREAGARLVPFAGWEMPVQYTSVVEEHRAVRGAAGLFDVSHMGEILVRGPGAVAFLEELTPNRVETLRVGRAQYSGLLTERGTYVDDLLVYRLGADELLLVVNAANAERDFAWVASRAPGDVEVRDVSEDYALLALQGPRAQQILSSLTSCDLGAIVYYGFAVSEVGGRPAIVSRTGYTGEDGFELYVSPEHAAPLWRMLLEAGRQDGLLRAGLAARDTLRLEAGMALYGHELDEDTTPLEAGLDWVVKLDKGPFLGREALLAMRAAGVPKRLVGIEVTGRGIAREGHRLLRADREVGSVTSGTWSPTFERAIAMAYVQPEAAGIGGELTVDVRGRMVTARVAELPFYQRSR